MEEEKCRGELEEFEKKLLYNEKWSEIIKKI